MTVLFLFIQNKRLSLDKLTGVFNRESFMNRINLLVNREVNFDVVFISIRDFKHFNDRLGQKAGDTFLQIFSQYLKSLVLPHCTFRYGGDVFAVLNDKEESKVESKDIIHKLKHRLNDSWHIDGFEPVVNAVISSVSFPRVANDTIEILGGIKLATEAAKKFPGTNDVACTREMLDLSKRSREIANILKEALEMDTFEIYYQPIWSENEKRFIFIEALLRLNETSLGAIFPDEFIPIAEDTGLLPEITYTVLDKVCKYINKIEEEGCNLPAIVSINFSSAQFLESDLRERVIEIINKNHISPGKIKIEITESTIINNPEVVREFMMDMHEVGVGFSLDDFGTGYSNLALILRLPFETIKIDKSVVWQAVEDEGATQFLANIIHAFSSFGVYVIAEGIENKEQRDLVVSCGCYALQGYLYAMPMDGENLIELLRKDVK